MFGNLFSYYAKCARATLTTYVPYMFASKLYLVSCWYICVWTILTSLEKLFSFSIMPVLNIESSNLTKALKRKMITINSNFVECYFSFRSDWLLGTGIHLPHPDPRSYPSWRPIFRFLQQRCMCVSMYHITGLCCLQLHQIGWLLLLCPYWWKGRLEWPPCHWRWWWRLGALENEICLKWLSAGWGLFQNGAPFLSITHANWWPILEITNLLYWLHWIWVFYQTCPGSLPKCSGREYACRILVVIFKKLILAWDFWKNIPNWN